MQIYTHLLQAGILRSIGGVVLAVAILLVMITVHEFGHYIVGRILGFKINEFSIGFGPAIFKKRSKKNGQLFALRVIPLGGYCAFDGEDEFADEQDETQAKQEQPFDELQNDGGMDAFNKENIDQTAGETDEYPQPQGARFNDQAPWKRILVLLAGVTMNYILALALIVTMFLCVGRPLYKVQVEKPTSETVTTSVAGEANGLQTGDIILKIDGKSVYLITDYFDALQGKKAGEEVEVLVLAGGEEITRTLTLAVDADFANLSDTNTLLDSMHIWGLFTVAEKQGFFPSLGNSVVYSFKIGGSLLRSLGELLTGKLGLEAMGGPVTTIKVTSEAAASSFMSFLNIAAFIGVNLAVFNLLPVPALDGCKIIFCLIEWIRKKPVNRKVEAIINIVGLFFLLGFAILVDVLQFF